MGFVRLGTGRDAADVAFATIFGTVTSSAPRIAIEAIAGADGRLVTPHHCTEALSTDGQWSSWFARVAPWPRQVACGRAAGSDNQRGPHNARCRASCRVPDFRCTQECCATKFAASGTADGASFGKVSITLAPAIVNAISRRYANG